MAFQQAELIDKGHRAMHDRLYDHAVIYLGQAMLAGEEVDKINGPKPVQLAKRFDRRLAVVTHAAELAMPRGLPTIEADRVRAERFVVARKSNGKRTRLFEADPDINGLNVVITYPFGGDVTSTSVWIGDDEISDALNKIEDNTSGWEEPEHINSSRQVAGIMNWAITEGSVVPVDMHGQRGLRDYAHAANLLVYNLFIGWAARTD